MNEREQCACWLAGIPGFGRQTIRKLVDCAGSEQEAAVLEQSEAKKVLPPQKLEHFLEWQKRRTPKEAAEEVERKGIRFVPWFAADYPDRLRQIPDAPYALYVRGETGKLNGRMIAVIGARECSAYGAYTAEQIGRKLAERGIGVVSGLARGIDGISQRAAVSAGGYSVGVLGCGVDICYPAENRRLYEQCIRQGGMVSEYPPGTGVQPWRFPPRNRIISGLADAVIVVEAREKSGTLITVDMALEQGKEVFAVPGRLTDPLSEGCNRLIGQGAQPFHSVEEMLEVLSAYDVGEEAGQILPEENTAYESRLQQLYAQCDFYPRCLTEFLQSLKKEPEWKEVTAGKLAEMLTELELRGWIGEKARGYYYRKK